MRFPGVRTTTLKNGRSLAAIAGASWLLMCAASSALRAQVKPVDSTRVAAPVTPRPAGPSAVRSRYTPPITPRRAFLYSAMLPGFGQSRLERGSSGALFAAVELAAMVMVRRSQTDLREARRYQTDTLPSNFSVGSTGTLTPLERTASRYDADLVRTRRLHVEDWLAVLAFNHLFAGADAFVAAQLWDIPVQLTAAPSVNGPLFVATVRF